MARPPFSLSELRRRKVWQVAVAYLAGALPTLLAVAELYDVFGLPEETPRTVAVLLAAGLPVALVLGWFLDVRRDRGGGPVTTEPSAPTTEGAERLTGDADSPIEEADRESIVVLPFDNFSPDEGDAWFCEGLTEEITTDLSYVRSLRVISRTSAVAFKSEGRGARDIHREHGVDYVHFQRANLGLGHEEEIERARSYAERALALDPESAQAHLVLGLVHVGADADVPGAISRFRRCLAITPDDSHALAWLLITYSLRGRVRSMKALLRRLREVDPYSPLIPGTTALIPWMSGRYSEALKPIPEWRAGGDALDFAVLFEVILLAWGGRTEEARDLVRREVPDDAPESYLQLCLIFAAAIDGDIDGVRAILDGDLRWIMQRDVQFAYIAASAVALAGLRDEALRWTRYVFEHGVVNYPWFAEHDPFLTRYRGDPEYEAILEEMRPVWEAEIAKDRTMEGSVAAGPRHRRQSPRGGPTDQAYPERAERT